MTNEAHSRLDAGDVAAGGDITGSSVVARTIGRGLTRAGAARIDGIDLLRGLVIVIMVLDHVRDYFHAQAFSFDPTNISRTTPLLFATRCVTHLCAPTFVFLSGASIYLQKANGKDIGSLTRFLLTRGLWLILLELTVVSFGFNFGAPFFFLQVIWAIGMGMIAMAVLVRLPASVVLALGIAIVAGHQLLAGIDAMRLGNWSGAFWRLFMEPGPTMAAPGLAVYPAIPWLGVMCLGYGFGFVFLQESGRSRRTMLVLASSALVAFVVLRLANGYGDPARWSPQASAVKTAMSFMNVSKYPPSLAFVFVTLGVSLLLLPALEKLHATAQRVLLTFGRTAFFTYVLHIYLLHVLAMLSGVLAGVPARSYLDFLGNPVPHIGVGFSLPVAYLAWVGIIVLMYPLSAWFERVKRERRDWWWSYL